MRRLRSWAAAAAVAALLLAQAAGLAHRIEHDVGHGPAGLGQALAAAAHGHAGHDHAHQDGADGDCSADGHAHDLHDATGATHEEGSSTCRLIDQAAHADAAPVASLTATLPAAAPTVPAPTGVQAVVKAGAQPYRARGPPSNLA